MKQKLWVMLGAQASQVKRIMLLELLRTNAESLNIDLDIGEITPESTIPNFSLNPQPQDAVLLIDMPPQEAGNIAGIQTFCNADELLEEQGSLLTQALSKAKNRDSNSASPVLQGDTVQKIVAVTSCPTGIAHTFMAAEGLQTGAKALGIDIRVETQGSVGAQDALTQAEIESADLVIIAADREVDRSRFKGKRLFVSGTKAAISNGQALIQKAIKDAKIVPAGNTSSVEEDSHEKIQSAGVYKHLMNGVSFMLPFVVAGGLMIALAFAIGGIDAGNDKNIGSLAHTLAFIGGEGGFKLMVPVLAGYIAYSIADRPGLAPGMIGGLIAADIGAGFLGGIVAGFLAGYVIKLLNHVIKLPRNLDGLKPVLILPFVGTVIVGLIMVYVVSKPVSAILVSLELWLRGMQGHSAFVLGAIVGGMMAVDMGGPVNKAAYATSVALISSGVYGPMAAVMAGGMVPPLAVALATVLFKHKFTQDEREAGPATAVLGLAFISEGAIPYAARDPLRVIPCFVVGAAITGGISMLIGSELHAPHGGIFVLFIPGAITHIYGYIFALIAGTIASTLLLGIFKRNVQVVNTVKDL